MGIDWEGILGDTSYEDAVEIARESLEGFSEDNIDYGQEWEEVSKLPGTNRIVIPTLFKMGKLQQNKEGKAEAYLSRIYDPNISGKYMHNGFIYNALLPYTKPLNKVSYDYKGKKDIEFLLPERPNNRMLFLQLIASDDDVYPYMDKSFALVSFWNKEVPEYSPSKKGKIEFRFGLDEYEKFETSEAAKYLVIEDWATRTKYAFICSTEQLPVPGKEEGAYVYVDGSAGDVENTDQFGSGAVVSIGKKVYFSHCEGEDHGKNVSAEYLAATKVFEHFPKENNDIKELYIYYDNNNVGYVPAELYIPGKNYNYAQDYIKAIKKFEKENPKTLIFFVHTDGHSGIFGNEMADQMAERKKKELEKLTPGFEEKRKQLCPEDGSFSEALTLGDC